LYIGKFVFCVYPKLDNDTDASCFALMVKHYLNLDKPTADIDSSPTIMQFAESFKKHTKRLSAGIPMNWFVYIIYRRSPVMTRSLYL